MKSMKNLIYSLILLMSVSLWSCTEEDFAEAYPNPATISAGDVDKLYTGTIQADLDYVIPTYFHYFVTLQTNVNPWIQVTVIPNGTGNYLPASNGVEAVWNNYYQMLAQYREFQKVWNASDESVKSTRQLLNLTLPVTVYYGTSKMVDSFGMMPFSEAGMLSTNSGDYQSSFAAFDQGEDIYTFMLDDLKRIASEMSTFTPTDNDLKILANQDIINNGDFDLWKRFTNSLRIRLLTRVSENPNFSSRAQSEIAEILGNPGAYPIIENNDQNAMIDIFDPDGTGIPPGNFNNGIDSDGWYGNDPSKMMVNIMNESKDVRRRVLFDPNVNGDYAGVDPLANAEEQTSMMNAGLNSEYSTSTLSDNRFIPGIYISASEVSFYLAEYYLENGNDAMAKAAYENGVEQSIWLYYHIRSVSQDTQSPPAAEPSAGEINTMMATSAINWTGSAEDKMRKIAEQKWIHFNIMQPYQNWAEVRRTGLPEMEFWVDNASVQTQPPLRWTIPGREITYNTENYNTVSSSDELNNPVFWDVN